MITLLFNEKIKKRRKEKLLAKCAALLREKMEVQV